MGREGLIKHVNNFQIFCLMSEKNKTFDKWQPVCQYSKIEGISVSNSMGFRIQVKKQKLHF